MATLPEESEQSIPDEEREAPLFELLMVDTFGPSIQKVLPTLRHHCDGGGGHEDMRMRLDSAEAVTSHLRDVRSRALRGNLDLD